MTVLENQKVYDRDVLLCSGEVEKVCISNTRTKCALIAVVKWTLAMAYRGRGLEMLIYVVWIFVQLNNVYNYYCLKTKAGDGLSGKPSPRVCLLYHSLSPKSHLISSLTPHFQRPKFTLASRWFQTQGVKLTKNEIWIFCQVYGSDIPDVIDHSSIIQTIFSTKKHPFERRTLMLF